MVRSKKIISVVYLFSCVICEKSTEVVIMGETLSLSSLPQQPFWAHFIEFCLSIWNRLLVNKWQSDIICLIGETLFIKHFVYISLIFVYEAGFLSINVICKRHWQTHQKLCTSYWRSIRVYSGFWFEAYLESLRSQVHQICWHKFSQEEVNFLEHILKRFSKYL